MTYHHDACFAGRFPGQFAGWLAGMSAAWKKSSNMLQQAVLPAGLCKLARGQAQPACTRVQVVSVLVN
jgi:hypothetical protein